MLPGPTGGSWYKVEPCYRGFSVQIDGHTQYTACMWLRRFRSREAAEKWAKAEVRRRDRVARERHAQKFMEYLNN